MTRRQLAGALAGAAPLLSQNAPAESAPDPLKESTREIRTRIEAVAKVELPMSTEPASVFRTF